MKVTPDLECQLAASRHATKPGLPKVSPACQAGHLAWPGRPDRDLTGRQAGIHPLIKLLIHFAMSIAIAVVGTLCVHLDYKSKYLRWREAQGELMNSTNLNQNS